MATPAVGLLAPASPSWIGRLIFTPGVNTSEDCANRNITSRNSTPIAGAASNWPWKSLALRGYFIRINGSRALLFGDDVDDVRRGLLHVEHDEVDAADEVIVADIRRDGDCQA